MNNNENKTEAARNLSFGHEILEQAYKLRKKDNALRVNVTFGDRHIEVEITDDHHGVLRTLLQVKINRAIADNFTARGWGSAENSTCFLMEDIANVANYVEDKSK